MSYRTETRRVTNVSQLLKAVFGVHPIIALYGIGVRTYVQYTIRVAQYAIGLKQRKTEFQ